jgi:hypothetical protein
MDERLIGWLIFLLLAILLVVGLIGIRRFWVSHLNMSDEDIALERRMSSLNEHQANRRRDDEIVRLLRGDEQRIVGDEEETR